LISRSGISESKRRGAFGLKNENQPLFLVFILVTQLVLFQFRVAAAAALFPFAPKKAGFPVLVPLHACPGQPGKIAGDPITCLSCLYLRRRKEKTISLKLHLFPSLLHAR
jgi:hypothetical protein